MEAAMRPLVRTAWTGVFLLGAATRVLAGDREDALALIDQAIKAHGGDEALVKAQNASRSGVGVLYQGGKETPFTDEVTWSLPDQLRVAIDVDKRLKLVFVVNGEKGWQGGGGPTADMGELRLKELHEEMYVQWLTALTPLKKDGFELTPLAEVKVGDRPAVGVKAVRTGHADVKLWFDKESHLLVRMQRRAEEAGIKIDKELQFSDYKEFDGVKLPTKQVETIEGKKFSELTSASYKLLKKIDEGTFAKP
jgi:hypothetical protein